MKVIYISETSLNNKSAQTIHVLKMCDAFCDKGNVDLLVPYCENQVKKKLKKDFLLTSKKKILVKSILDFKIQNFFTRLISSTSKEDYPICSLTHIVI